MPAVKNWQLGRDMQYEYPEARPAKQVSAVFDINKCIACQTCTYACKTTWTSGKGQEYMFWNSVETKPWGSYPLAWDVKDLDLLGKQEWSYNSGAALFKGKTIFESAPPGERVLGWRPEDLDWANPNRGEDETSGMIDPSKYHLTIPQQIWTFYLARICNHCTFPACVAACPRKAIYKRQEDGIVLIDQQRCRGYRECVRACPFKRPMYNHVTRVSEKCVFCFPAVEQGIIPRCMRNCIGKIRTVGYIHTPDKADPENPIDFLVHVKKVALPFYAQFGTEPNMYYIPPIHVPTSFTKQMFGPAVDDAIATYNRMREGKEPELRALLLLSVSSDRVLSKFKVDGDEVVGYDQDGKECARANLEEPKVVRPYRDDQYGVYRHNFT